MMVLFEVFLGKNADASTLLGEEVLRDTKAQLMTPDEARAVGFQGLPDVGDGVRYIAVAKRDAQWIHRALETNEQVSKFRMFDVD